MPPLGSGGGAGLQEERSEGNGEHLELRGPPVRQSNPDQPDSEPQNTNEEPAPTPEEPAPQAHDNPQSGLLDEASRLEAAARVQAHKSLKPYRVNSKALVDTANLAEDAKQIIHDENDEQLKRQLKAASRMGNSKDKQIVPLERVIKFLEDRNERKRMCFNIPFTIGYYLMFGLMIHFHENTVDLSQVEREFRFMMEGTSFEGVAGTAGVVLQNPFIVSGHKVMVDIDVIQDVYTYMQDAILPLFIQNGVPDEDVNRVLSYNQIVGGVAFQMTKKEHKLCADEYPDMGPFNADGKNPLTEAFGCYPTTSVDEECFGNWTSPPWNGTSPEGFCSADALKGRRLAESQPFVQRAVEYVVDTMDYFGASITPAVQVMGKKGRRLSASAHAARSRMGRKNRMALTGEATGSLFTVHFHEHEGLGAAIDKLKFLQDHDWMNVATSWAGIKVFILNADLGVMCSAMINIYFAPSGELVPYMVANAFQIEPYAFGATYAMDGIFFLLWLKLAIECILSAIKACRSKEPTGYFRNAWNYVEWFTFIGGGVMIALWFAYLHMLGNVKEKAADVVMKRPTPGVAPSDDYMRAYKESVLDLQLKIIYFDNFMELARVAFGWYMMFIMVRFFKVFEAQPRLKVVTDTIVKSNNDLLHFSLVFLTMFAAFVTSGMLLFGNRMIEFASFTQAIFECGQILLGNFDYDELAEESPVSTFIWFQCYIWIMTNIMLNIILAIIMDVYAAAKNDADPAFSDPIWKQLRFMIKETVDRKNQLPSSEILQVCRNLPEEKFEWIGVTTLLEHCPSMSREQGEEIIDSCKQMEVHDDNQELTFSDATRLVAGIKHEVETIESLIHEIRQVQKQDHVYQEKAKEMAAMFGETYDPSQPVIHRLDEHAEKKIRSLETRLDKLEDFLNEAMSYMVFRGKEVRNRLKAMEDFLRGRRDSGGGATGSDWPVPSFGPGAGASRNFSNMPPPTETSNRWS